MGFDRTPYSNFINEHSIGAFYNQAYHYLNSSDYILQNCKISEKALLLTNKTVKVWRPKMWWSRSEQMLQIK